ncbi:MAG: molecular chaperone DnaJ [Alphaproteobacteria bacterium]|nr:molecular chaperone DnaJ [Alphaproteobacteria bacterium]
MTRARRTANALAESYDPRLRACDQPGCLGEGMFRAPKARDRLQDYFWFCLAHVRAYNAAWDFYRGMSPGEIERQVRNDTVWQRPTWPLGPSGRRQRPEAVEIEDPFDIFGEGPGPRPTAESRMRDLPPEERDALAILDLAPDVTLEELKSRYKVLVKRHHPDANGGDRQAEERVKAINLAYSTLRKRLAA